MSRARRSLRPIDLPALALACLGSAACGDGAAPLLVQADSAGVAIVEVTAAGLSAADEWRLADAPTHVLGGDAVDRSLFRVQDVRRLSDGRVAVVNGGSQEVIVFTDDGSVDARYGGIGDGPGEFRRLQGAFEVGNGRVAGIEARSRRLTLFGRDSEPVGELALRGGAPDWAIGRLLPMRDGWLFFSQGGFHRQLDAVDRAMVESARYDAEGGLVTLYGPFPGDEMFSGNDLGAVMFGAKLRGDLAGDRLVVGDSDHAEVRLYGPDGSLERIVRWPEGDRAIRDDMVDRWVVATAMGAAPERRTAVAERLREMVPRADVLPSLDAVHSTAAGFVWVGRIVEPGSGGARPGPQAMEWYVLGPEGRLEGVLTTPDGFEILSVEADGVWGVHHDELDRETVRFYPVIPG